MVPSLGFRIVEAEAVAASFKKLEAEAEVEELHAEAEAIKTHCFHITGEEDASSFNLKIILMLS